MIKRISVALIIAFSPAALAQTCACDHSPPAASKPIPIEIVDHNVFVPVTLSQGAKCTTVYFILDTGSNRTIIEEGTSELLGFPVVTRANLIAPGGTRATFNVRVSCLRIGAHQFTNVEAAVQDTTLYSAHYKRQVAGLIGTDLLHGAITQIDFSNKMLTMIADKPLARRPEADLPLSSIQGLPLITCTLPPSLQADLIVDTGCDCEFTVYDGVASKVRTDRSKTVNRSDASGISVDQTRADIESAACGDLALGPASVIMAVSTDATRYGGAGRPGMLGNVILSRYLVELDLKDNRLRLFKPLKARGD
jgi:predicted aspartyl protease